jgi:hypothetical protein
LPFALAAIGESIVLHQMGTPRGAAYLCFVSFLTGGEGKIPVNELYNFGRKSLSFAKGVASLTKISITEKSLLGEDEKAFTQRLLKKYGNDQGTMEIVFKNGRPDYAIITLLWAANELS